MLGPDGFDPARGITAITVTAKVSVWAAGDRDA
jgi:hypothetical protein